MLLAVHMTPEQENARRKRLVTAARAVLSLQVGLGVGCSRINRELFWLGAEHRDRFPIFDEFLKAALGYPIGTERLQWAPESLLKADRKLAAVESDFRTRILKSCIEIIKDYG